jgi:hypothetical protein
MDRLVVVPHRGHRCGHCRLGTALGCLCNLEPLFQVNVRALMSAPNASVALHLRCFVRERLIQFLQEKYPESLPKTRPELVRDITAVPVPEM